MSETNKKITATIEYWTIWTVALPVEYMDAFQQKKPGALPQVVTGQVVKDFQGRWRCGDTLRTTALSRVDLENNVVYTQNSVYQLIGPGLHKTGAPDDPAQAVSAAQVELSGLLKRTGWTFQS
ncbi:MAG: hypothetical protein V7739_20105 [Motiliproteus sp.]